jgi:hypothetical protein
MRKFQQSIACRGTAPGAPVLLEINGLGLNIKPRQARAGTAGQCQQSWRDNPQFAMINYRSTDDNQSRLKIYWHDSMLMVPVSGFGIR